MELQFEQTPFVYLHCALRKSDTHEESMEVIIPDRLPDVDRILSTDACVCMREKECRQGSASVSGGIRAVVLYADNTTPIPQKLETYLPFSVRVDQSDITETSDVLFSASVCAVEAKILNSRKILLRVSFVYCMTVYSPATEIRYGCEDRPVGFQVRESTYSLFLPVEYAERNFSVTDGVLLSQTDSVLNVEAKAEISEKRIAGNKAVFKGTVDCRVAYLAEDGRYTTEALQIPFSQFCELRENYDDDAVLSAVAVISDCSWEKAANPDSLTIEINLTVQCLVSKTIQLPVTNDAYCLNSSFTPEWKQYSFDTQLDLQSQSDSVRAFAECDVREVLDARVCVGVPTVQRENMTASVTVPSGAEVLYRDGSDQLQRARLEHSSVFTCNLSETATLNPEAMLCSGISAVPTGDGIEVRYTVCLMCASTAKWTQRTIVGGDFSEQTAWLDRPQLIAKRVDGRQELWDIAKAYNTTVERICRANNLDQDWFADGVLLIPMEWK